MNTETIAIEPEIESLMRQEASESWDRIREQLEENKVLIQGISQRLIQMNPRAVMIVGRGSSDHAGVFAKYLIEIETGIPTFSAAPSIRTIYNKQLNLEDCVVIIISQSGRSPDILEEAKQSKKAGAYCIALLNDESSPLAEIVDRCIPLCAGPEKSVAATKSYLSTLTAILQLVAYWKEDKQLVEALETLPAALKDTVEAPHQLRKEHLDNVDHLVVLGRGLGYAISKEIALKLKEVCAIQAEAFSSAEFLHGPVTLVENQLEILSVNVLDESTSAHEEIMSEIIKRGSKPCYLQHVYGGLHPRIAPLTIMLRFYLDIEKIAVQNGLNPDQPRGLKKVTQTL